MPEVAEFLPDDLVAPISELQIGDVVILENYPPQVLDGRDGNRWMTGATYTVNANNPGTIRIRARPRINIFDGAHSGRTLMLNGLEVGDIVDWGAIRGAIVKEIDLDAARRSNNPHPRSLVVAMPKDHGTSSGARWGGVPYVSDQPGELIRVHPRWQVLPLKGPGYYPTRPAPTVLPQKSFLVPIKGPGYYP